MSLLGRIRAALRREPPPSAPVLRNRVGGMAWIQVKDDMGTGADAMTGRAVKTVAVNAHGLWTIDPVQTYVAAKTHRLHNAAVIYKGQTAIISGIADSALIPWKEDGVSDSEVRDLYQPKPERTTA